MSSKPIGITTTTSRGEVTDRKGESKGILTYRAKEASERQSAVQRAAIQALAVWTVPEAEQPVERRRPHEHHHFNRALDAIERRGARYQADAD